MQGESDLPLEGTKAPLEELKESLYQRERETEKSPTPPIIQPPSGVLLPAVIQKVAAELVKTLKVITR